MVPSAPPDRRAAAPAAAWPPWTGPQVVYGKTAEFMSSAGSAVDPPPMSAEQESEILRLHRLLEEREREMQSLKQLLAEKERAFQRVDATAREEGAAADLPPPPPPPPPHAPPHVTSATITGPDIESEKESQDSKMEGDDAFDGVDESAIASMLEDLEKEHEQLAHFQALATEKKQLLESLLELKEEQMRVGAVKELETVKQLLMQVMGANMAELAGLEETSERSNGDSGRGPLKEEGTTSVLSSFASHTGAGAIALEGSSGNEGGCSGGSTEGEPSTSELAEELAAARASYARKVDALDSSFATLQSRYSAFADQVAEDITTFGSRSSGPDAATTLTLALRERVAGGGSGGSGGDDGVVGQELEPELDAVAEAGLASLLADEEMLRMSAQLEEMRRAREAMLSLRSGLEAELRDMQARLAEAEAEAEAEGWRLSDSDDVEGSSDGGAAADPSVD